MLLRVLTGAHDDPVDRARRVLAMHSVSKRSNLAGMRVGFYVGDPDLVTYLVETRKHAGLMAPTMAQAAAAAALGDDAHVDVQRARYAERRQLVGDALAPHGIVHDGGDAAFYLWMRTADGADDGWEIAARLADEAVCSCRPATSTARSAPTTYASCSCNRATGSSSRSTGSCTHVPDPTRSRTEEPTWTTPNRPRSCSKPETTGAKPPRSRRRVSWSAGIIGRLDRGEIRVAEIVDDKVVVNEAAKMRP